LVFPFARDETRHGDSSAPVVSRHCVGQKPKRICQLLKLACPAHVISTSLRPCPSSHAWHMQGLGKKLSLARKPASSLSLRSAVVHAPTLSVRGLTCRRISTEPEYPVRYGSLCATQHFDLAYPRTMRGLSMWDVVACIAPSLYVRATLSVTASQARAPASTQ
jgi:hypothetical protein